VRDLSRDVISKYLKKDILEKLEKSRCCVISFSGGIDSSVLVGIMASLIPPQKIHAVMFRSFLHFAEEMERGIQYCHSLGVTLKPLPGPELYIEEVMKNSAERCGYCKKARATELLDVARSLKADLILEGSNADDLKDPSRLGTKVLQGIPQIFSPLAQSNITKQKVRELARDLRISWWNEEPTACLATRFPEGHELQAWECAQVAKGEWNLRKAGFRQVRIRVFKDIACLQVPLPQLEQILSKREEVIGIIRDAGFKQILLDLEGYEWGRKWIVE
jgi:uncharacterized protein